VASAELWSLASHQDDIVANDIKFLVPRPAATEAAT
jgi:hypothetical protein